jgi:hypothetical protein
MKTLLGAMLFAVVTQVHAQAIEADLDGNATALQASEMRPPSRKPVQVARQSQPVKKDRQRVAAR